MNQVYTDLESRGESLRTTLAHIFYGFGPDDFELDEGSILNDAMKVIEAYVEEEKRKAALEARIDELDSLPWKRSDKYGINTPYVTKAWLLNRKAELNRHPRVVGTTMPDGQVVRLHSSDSQLQELDK